MIFLPYMFDKIYCQNHLGPMFSWKVSTMASIMEQLQNSSGCLFLLQIVFFYKFVHFIQVSKFIGRKLFIVCPHYLSDICSISGKAPFILFIVYICLFFLDQVSQRLVCFIVSFFPKNQFESLKKISPLCYVIALGLIFIISCLLLLLFFFELLKLDAQLINLQTFFFSNISTYRAKNYFLDKAQVYIVIKHST